MGPMIMVLAFGAVAMTTVVMCDLRDSKTHRWKPVTTRRQYAGHVILFLNVVAFGAAIVLLGRYQ